MTGAELLAALEAAGSAGDVLAALAGGVNPDKGAPSPEALAPWWPECPDKARFEAVERLQALARIAVPDAPPALIDGCRFWELEGGGTDHDLYVAWPMVAWDGRKLLDSGDRMDWIRGALGIEALSRRWIEADPDTRPGHPLAPIVRAWIERPRGLAHRHLIATREKYSPKGSDPLTMTRHPGLLSLVSHAPLEAVAVDGEAFATRTIGGVETKMRRWRLAESQGDLFPGPRELAGQATAGAILEAVAFMVLAGDERSPLRADLLRLANLI